LSSQYRDDFPYAAVVHEPKAAGAGAGLQKPEEAGSYDEGRTAARRSLFNQYCAHCHSPDAVSPDPPRDLRRLKRRYGEKTADVFYFTHGRAESGSAGSSPGATPVRTRAFFPAGRARKPSPHAHAESRQWCHHAGAETRPAKKGMPSWKEVLDDETLWTIFAFLETVQTEQ
jgi:mono/diheme cytochrome c family protein